MRPTILILSLQALALAGAEVRGADGPAEAGSGSPARQSMPKLKTLPPLPPGELPLSEALQRLNPDLADPVAHVNRQFQALRQSELGLLLRDLGTAQAADALVGKEARDTFIDRFFDHYARLRYGLAVPDFEAGVRHDRLIQSHDAVPSEVQVRCLCDVNLTDWLYPAGSQKLFRSVPAPASPLFYLYSMDAPLRSVSHWNASSQGEADVMPMLHDLLMSAAEATPDRGLAFAESVAKEFAALPELMTKTIRERVTLESFIELSEHWRHYREAMAEVIRSLPRRIQYQAEGMVREQAAKLASNDVADRDSAAWRSRYFYHLEREEYLYLVREARSRADFSESLTKQLVRHLPQLQDPAHQRKTFRWIGGDARPIDALELLYREFFRVAYRVAQADSVILADQVKSTADLFFGRTSTIIPLSEGRSELVWGQDGHPLTWNQVTRLTSLLEELAALRQSQYWNASQAEQYGKVLDKVILFEHTGKSRQLWFRPFLRQRLLTRWQRTIYKSLRLFRADDPNPDHWGKCPTSFVP